MTRYWRIAILALFLFGCSVAEGGPENVARTEFEKWAKNRGKQYQNVQVSVAKNDGTYTAVRIIAGFREAPSLPWIEEEVTAECHKVVDKWYCDTLILLVDPAQVKAETDAPMVIVPAGNFYMGVSELKIGSEFRERHEQLDEMPQHWVYLDTFWVEKYEVTNKLYKKCVDAGKCSAPKSSSSATRSSYYGNIEYHNYPVINVSWYDASSYCTWVG